MPKDQRFGQAAILPPEQLQDLCNSFPVGQHKYISLVLAFSGARVSEVLALQWRDIKDDYILFKSINTKTKKTRNVNLHPKLKSHLKDWKEKYWYQFPMLNQNKRHLERRAPTPDCFLFRGKYKNTHLTRQAFDKQLRAQLDYLLIEGATTHSYRRTNLTAAKDAGMALSDIMQISGHTSLDALNKYLAPNEKEMKKVVGTFGF